MEQSAKGIESLIMQYNSSPHSTSVHCYSEIIEWQIDPNALLLLQDNSHPTPEVTEAIE